MNKYKTLAKDTGLFAISDFASKCITFLLLPIYTNVLTTTEYGQVDLLNNMVNLVYPLLTLSIVEATIRFALDSSENNNMVLSAALTFVFGGTCILLFLTPFSVYFGDTFHENWYMFIALYNGYSLRMLFSYYCRGCKKNIIFAIQGILQTVCAVALNLILLLLFNMRLEGYLIATIFSYYASILYIIVAGKMWNDIFDFHLDFGLIRRMLKFSIPMIPTLVAWWFVNSMDKYYIIAMVGISYSGVYAVAHKIPTILNTVTQIFNKAWQISSVSIYEDVDNGKKYTEIYRWFYFLCFSAGFAINTIAQPLGILLFAKEYYIAWTYVPPLVIAAVFSSMAGFLAQIFTSAKKTNVLFSSTVVGACLNAILNYLFILEFDTIGAAYATMISYFMVWVSRCIAVRKIVDLKVDFIFIIKSTVLLIVHCLLILYFSNYQILISCIFWVIFICINYRYFIKLSNFVKRFVQKR